MDLLRTIHSAGCGSFCTETFFHFHRHPFFNVVYDCGSSDIKDQVIQKAKNYFNTYGNINLLFVSHLDDDHINGIKELRQFMDKYTKVILPYFEDSYKLLSYDGYFKSYFSFLDYLIKEGIPYIFVRPDEEGPRNHPEPTNIDGLDKGSEIASGSIIHTQLHPDFVWEYIPFNIQDSVNLEQVKKECKEQGMSDEDIDDCINNRTFDDRIIKTLKKVCKKVSKKYSNTTEANMSSMLLISKEGSPADIIESKVTKGWHTSPSKTAKHLTFSTEGYELDRASCLYTGDAGLYDKQYFNIVLKYYQRFLSNGVGIMQIPHHGTVHYYPQNLHDQIEMEMGFVNITIQSRNPLFYAYIPFDFAINQVPLYIVNDKPFSTIANRVYLEW